MVYEGSYQDLVSDGGQSITARYLRGDCQVHAIRSRRPVNPSSLEILRGQDAT